MNQLQSEQIITSDGRVNRLKIILILGALSALGPLTIDMYLPGWPIMTKEFGASTSAIQLTLTACLLGLAFGQLFIGSLSDTHGRRMPLLLSLIVYTIASILCAFAPNIWALVIFRFIQGFAGSAGLVISRACIRDLYSGTELTRYYAMVVLVMGVAPIFAPVIGGQLLHFFPWQGIFIALFFISIGLFLIVLTSLPETLSKQRKSKGGLKNMVLIFGSLCRNRIFMGYALTQGLMTASLFAYISGSSFVYQEVFGVSPQVFSILFGLNGFGYILATQIGGRLAGKVKETMLLYIGLGIGLFGGSLFMLVVLISAGLPFIIVSLFLIVSSIGLVNPSCFSLAMQNQAGNAGSASALLGLMPFLFGALVAPIVGHGGSGTALPMAVLILLAEVGAILVFLVMVQLKKKNEVLQST